MSNVLILLIGGNPLPNYVTAKYMLDETRNDTEALPVPDNFILLHSNITKDYAQKIKEKMKLTGYGTFVNLGDDERSKEKISEAISDKLTKLKDECIISSIHLNYTGGTKPMAVHAYNEIEKFCKAQNNKSIKSIFTYLDPVQFKLVLDESEACYPAEPDKDLRNKVKLEIKDLFDIHLMKYEKEGDLASFNRCELDIREFSKNILKSYPEPKWSDFFFTLKKNLDCLKKKKKKKKSIYYPVRKINDFCFDGIEDLNKNKSFQGINADIPSLKNFFKDNKFDLSLAEPEKKFTELIKFISGIWLEDFIVDVIRSLKKNNEIAYDKIDKSVHATYKKRHLEVDIIVMKGYQMFLFSCTADDNTENVKSKAFEAVFRAEQLGGDHATAVTVSCIKNVAPVDNALRSFEAKQQYKLIGITDLLCISKLNQTLTDIIGN